MKGKWHKLCLLVHLERLQKENHVLTHQPHRSMPARYLLAWVFHGTADDRRNGASLFLLFSVSPFPGSPVVGVVSPPTSRDNYVRDTPFSETCDRDCKMSYARSLLSAADAAAYPTSMDKMCVVSPCYVRFFERFDHSTPSNVTLTVSGVENIKIFM